MNVSTSFTRTSNLALVTLLLGSLALGNATMFLGKEMPVHLESNPESERNLLNQIEEVLGSEHRTFTEKRLKTIIKSLQPIFTALPKNEHGKLGSAATSYALYRIFVARHAWFVVGLEPFKAMAEWNSSSPTSLLDQRVPEFISGLFKSRMGETGFGLHEVAVLAATLEHLVHKESLIRADAAYKSLNFSKEDVLSGEEVQSVMDSYMTLYILGPLVPNVSKVSPKLVRELRTNVTELYPGFPETQQFLRDVEQSVAPKRDYFYYSDVASVVEEVGDRYGRWQDHDCRSIKDMLVEIEDPSSGGGGRVRMADFYDQALNHGKWQLVESVDYLRQLGALDESNPNNLRLIIPNYINGPSNCVASSSYYSVCCVNECDELLGNLEQVIAAPEATPEQIIAVVEQMPSSTVPGGRTLPLWLTTRLDEAATHHGGLVPIHGRLLNQWMHFAFPRECPYPHVLGATRPQTADIYVKETGTDFAASSSMMEHHISLPKPHQPRATETGALDEVLSMESPMWTLEEELVVWKDPSTETSKQTWLDFGLSMRGFMYMAALVSFGVGVKNAANPKSLSGNPEKYYV